jgi:hypothetical protein
VTEAEWSWPFGLVRELGRRHLNPALDPLRHVPSLHAPLGQLRCRAPGTYLATVGDIPGLLDHSDLPIATSDLLSSRIVLHPRGRSQPDADRASPISALSRQAGGRARCARSALW